MGKDLVVGLSVKGKIPRAVLAQSYSMSVSYGGEHQVPALHPDLEIGRIESRRLADLASRQPHVAHQNIDHAACL